MARIDFKEALGWNRDQLQDLRSAGYDYLRQGHYAAAITYFEALVALDPMDFYDTMTLGALYLQTTQYRLALPLLDRALVLNPDSLPVQLNRAKTYFGLGQHAIGLDLVGQLSTCPNAKIRDLADALVMAYS